MKNHFESSLIKHEIRKGICQQMLTGARLTKQPALVASTLPGRFWNFETRLEIMAEYERAPLPIRLNCYESEEEIFNSGNPMVDVKTQFPKTEIGNFSVAYHLQQFLYSLEDNAVWADYCGCPSVDNLGDFLAWTNAKEGWALGYITLTLTVRCIACLPDELRCKWVGASFEDKAKWVADYLNQRIKPAHRQVFSYVYNHGRGHLGTSRMVTLGFELRPTTKTIRFLKPITKQQITRFTPTNPGFKDMDLAKAIYFYREIQALPAKETAAILNISSGHIGAIRATTPIYKGIVQRNKGRTIKKLADVI